MTRSRVLRRGRGDEMWDMWPEMSPWAGCDAVEATKWGT